MPELPEVETVARQLREREPILIGRTIVGVEVGWAKTVATHRPDEFAAYLGGQRFTGVTRHGKTLKLALSGSPGHLLVHLRMSGRLDVVQRADATTKHARVIIHLDDDLALRFDDARKFGRMWLVHDPAEVLGEKGPDALEVSENEFVDRLGRKTGRLKSVLLDQSFIAGVGNIYADEALFRAGLRPTRQAARLKHAGAAGLYQTIRHVLQEGIVANGASFDWVYPDGNFQENFRVYGRTGKPCVTCGTAIRRILVGQRATHFCPNCQK